MTNLDKTTLITRRYSLFAVAAGILVGILAGILMLLPTSHVQQALVFDASIPTITIVGKRLPKTEAMNTASSADAASAGNGGAAAANTAIADAM